MRFTEAKLIKIFAKTGGKCYYCYVPLSGDRSFPGDYRPGVWNVDHLFPDGGNDLDNLVPSCVPCNSRKGVLQPDDFFRVINKEDSQGKPFSFTTLILGVAFLGVVLVGVAVFFLNHKIDVFEVAFRTAFQQQVVRSNHVVMDLSSQVESLTNSGKKFEQQTINYAVVVNDLSSQVESLTAALNFAMKRIDAFESSRVRFCSSRINNAVHSSVHLFEST